MKAPRSGVFRYSDRRIRDRERRTPNAGLAASGCLVRGASVPDAAERSVRCHVAQRCQVAVSRLRWNDRARGVERSAFAPLMGFAGI